MKLFASQKLLLFLTIIACVVLMLSEGCHSTQKDMRIWNTDSLLRKGDSIVALTTDTMLKAIAREASDNSFASAIEFCNIAAIGITAFHEDSSFLAKRITNKTRNANNRLTQEDIEIFNNFQQNTSSNKAAKAVLITSNQKAVYYKPIIIQPLCLNCHGDAKEIASATLRAISSIYPSDSAKNYRQGELRGLWKISFYP